RRVRAGRVPVAGRGDEVPLRRREACHGESAPSDLRSTVGRAATFGRQTIQARCPAGSGQQGRVILAIRGVDPAGPRSRGPAIRWLGSTGSLARGPRGRNPTGAIWQSPGPKWQCCLRATFVTVVASTAKSPRRRGPKYLWFQEFGNRD